MRNAITIWCCIIAWPYLSASQNLTFHHIHKSNGLSSYAATCAVTDKNGFLWIGTNNGLNRYDGKTVDIYLKNNEPSLLSNQIAELFCDSYNRIWVCTPLGVSMIDSNRQFHIIKPDTLSNYITKNIIETSNHEILLLTGRGGFIYREKENRWEKLIWLDPILKNQSIRLVIPNKKDEYFIIVTNYVIRIDVQNQKLIDSFYIKDVRTGALLNDHELILGDFNSHIICFDFEKHTLTQKYQLNYTENGRLISENIFCIRRSNMNEVFIGTSNRGLIRLDPTTGKKTYFQHNPGDPYSVGFNSINTMYCAPNGYIALISTHEGVDIVNTQNNSADYSKLLIDNKGNTYDNQIFGMTEDEDGNVWIAALDRLIRWNPIKNEQEFIFYPYTDERYSPASRYVSFKALLTSNKNQIWFSTPGAGFGSYDIKSRQFRSISQDTTADKGSAIKSKFVYDIQYAPDSSIWGGTSGGIFQYNPVTNSINSYYNHPTLNILNKKRINKLYFDKNGLLWVGTNTDGAFCYNEKKQSLIHINSKIGLTDNNVTGFVEDDSQNMYIATGNGFSIIDAGGRVKTYSTNNGLKSNVCNGFLKDNSGCIWLSNEYNIIRYNPADSSFTYFGEENGFSKEGFLPFSYFQTKSGLMIWGTNKGFNYFHPEQLKKIIQPINLLVVQAYDGDSVFPLSNKSSLRLPQYRNSVTFNFTAVDPAGTSGIIYEYQLEGVDKKWTRTEAIKQVRYNALPPGQYLFKVRASSDGLKWINCSNNISLFIDTPVWKKWWVRIVVIMLIISAFIYLIKRRFNSVRKEASLKQKLSETEMKALHAQMNPHFIFNCLNAIDNLIQTNQKDKATTYLARFAKLIRGILDSSKNNVVPFYKDYETLQLYLQLEQFRCNNKFEYKLVVTDDLLNSDIQVPPLIIQPFVENAILHGLLNKQTGARILSIHISSENDWIKYLIIDNGVGRARAEELKNINKPGHISYGINISKERINLFNQNMIRSRKSNERQNNILITDLYENSKPAGTAAEIYIRIHDNN